jgi:L-iditol 2-dehydrogenase
MKALVLESNGRLRYQTVPDPQPAADECLLAVRAAGVCSSDIPRAFNHGAYHTPLIMGHEFAGEVVACGSAVTGIDIGQKTAVFPLLPCFNCPACAAQRWVHCRQYDYYGSRRDGGFSQFIAVKAWNLLPIPDGCDVELAALCEPLAVCIHTIKSIPADAHGRLAIIGAGFMGLCLAHLAQQSGRFAEICLFDRNQFKLDKAADFGWQTIMLSTALTGLPNLSGLLFDVVIEASGAVTTYQLSLALAAHGGHIIWLGNIADDWTLHQKEVSSVLRRELTIHGVWNSTYQPHSKPSDWTEALDLICTADWLPGLVSHWPTLAEGPVVLNDLHDIKLQHRLHDYLKVCFRL